MHWRTILSTGSERRTTVVVAGGEKPQTVTSSPGDQPLLLGRRIFLQLATVILLLVLSIQLVAFLCMRSALRDAFKRNAETYKKQVSKILDIEKIEVVFNSRWFEKMSILDLLRLTTHATVAQMLTRADFKKRMSQEQDISLLEFMYPLLQGYDSVELKADVELGGTDQIFNLLYGRQIQKDFGQEPQIVITMPLLEGTDGVQKMSKSYSNFVGINEPAKDMVGKIMSVSDELMLKYYTLLTDDNLEAVKKMHPKQAKLNLGKIIASQYHSKNEAEEAALEFDRVFAQKQNPQDMQVYKLVQDKTILEILIENGLVDSKNEARRLIQQGAVTLDELRIDKEDTIIAKPGILKVGKRRFLKLVKS